MNNKFNLENRITKVLLVNVVVFIMLISLVSAAGIGVSPSEVFFDKVLKGSAYVKDLKIYNSADGDIMANITLTGYNDWFRFDPGASVKVLAKSSASIKIIATIPTNTPNGMYESTGFVTGTPVVPGQGMGLIPGVGFKIKVNVTDQMIAQGYVDNILTRDTTLNKNVMFLIGFMNRGNVPVAPRAKITIKDENGNQIDSFEKQFDSVNPGLVQSLIAEYETMGRPLGSYQAFVQVYLDNSLLSEKNLYFKILEQMPSQNQTSPSTPSTPLTPPSQPSVQPATNTAQQPPTQTSTGSGPKITLITAETGPPSRLSTAVIIIIVVGAIIIGAIIGTLIAISLSRKSTQKIEKEEKKIAEKVREQMKAEKAETKKVEEPKVEETQVEEYIPIRYEKKTKARRKKRK